ncbi:YdcF family protein [Thiocapsa roseopersicina]|uniref:Uncharacterized SAM-binding protein YcdF, DUF218 family n=1 Tax=Thiocapsa roseopersicina TaxID=1058 RepID=A0A1H2QBM6_THIRO|nr:YdcF family protein [Thiocapsa roseopersicina]SDW04657.1 Uncharacterized SAM-binding protein YcdF, DUF218 family [Thiocapsa roseopersicina]
MTLVWLSPLLHVLALWALALLLLALGRQRAALVAGLIGWIWLTFWSLPIVSGSARVGLEAEFPAIPIERLPHADAIVVLGGAIGTPDARRPFPTLTDSSDRLWQAARLYRAGRAPMLVLSGGSDTAVALTSEAQAMQVFLSDMGVPPDVMLLEERSRTTLQNAEFSAVLLREEGIERVLLVTSAFHMRRAMDAFEAQGLQALPAAADHAMAPAGPGAWIPSAGALNNAAFVIKEWVGRAVGRVLWSRPDSALEL